MVGDYTLCGCDGVNTLIKTSGRRASESRFYPLIFLTIARFIEEHWTLTMPSLESDRQKRLSERASPLLPVLGEKNSRCGCILQRHAHDPSRYKRASIAGLRKISNLSLCGYRRCLLTPGLVVSFVLWNETSRLVRSPFLSILLHSPIGHDG